MKFVYDSDGGLSYVYKPHHLELFNMELVICIAKQGEGLVAARPFYNDYYDDDHRDLSQYGALTSRYDMSMTGRNPGMNVYSICCVFSHPIDERLMVHEAFHATELVLQSNGIPQLDSQNPTESELWAMTLSYIYTLIKDVYQTSYNRFHTTAAGSYETIVYNSFTM